MADLRTGNYIPPEKTTGIDLIVFANIYESLFRRNHDVSPDKATREQLVGFAEEVEGIFESHQETMKTTGQWRTLEGGIVVEVNR